jgi:peptidoglycan-N-acetylglucosamine deacetylase
MTPLGSLYFAAYTTGVGLASIGGGAAIAAVGAMTYAVRGRSSTLLADSVWRGPADRKSVALTFDDGPSESTPELLAILAEYRVRATFFLCGSNVRRLPEIARAIANAGHEIGNHGDAHRYSCFKSGEFIRNDLAAAQETIAETTGVSPRLYRPPYGVRWFGMRQAMRGLGLSGVMWSTIGLDWKRSPEEIVARIMRQVRNGAIICLHDGRALAIKPDIRPTLKAVESLLPVLRQQGFAFDTVTGLLTTPGAGRRRE